MEDKKEESRELSLPIGQELEFVDIRSIEPRENSGAITQIRFQYQKEFIAYKCIELLEQSDVSEVYCDFHDDCVVKYSDKKYHFYQIKGVRGAFTLSKFKESLPNMYHNFMMVKGKARCILVTNAQKDRSLENWTISRLNIRNNIATQDEILMVNKFIEELRSLVNEQDLFQQFMETIEIIEEFPSFKEIAESSKITITDYNINRLSSVISDTMGIPFKREDVANLYDIILNLVKEKSQLKTRADRCITKEMILNHLDLASTQREYFTTNHNTKEVEKLKDQTILQMKLEKGKFTKEFISRAKLLRYAAKYHKDKLSKMKYNKKVLDTFEFKLVDICVDVSEEHKRKEHFDSLLLLNDLKTKLIALTNNAEFQGLHLPPEFVKGLIFEATSKCSIRWSDE